MNKQSPSFTASADNSLTQWLAYLESIHPTAIDMGLTRVKQVADKLALDFSNQTVITVAGTNGKGTTCRFIEQACLAQGKTTGVYSSPHLLDYRERVRINGDIEAERLYCEAFAAIEQARGDISLTYFEFGTLAAMLMMVNAGVDIAILEVGLGGRLDATNIIEPSIAIITTIGLDHMDWLGDTREAIAIEKAGIMRNNGIAVVGEREPPSTLDEYVSEHQVDTWWAGRTFGTEQQGDMWRWYHEDEQTAWLPIPQIPLQNVATALATLKRLGLFPDNTALQQLVSTVNVPGRRQTLSQSPEVLVDVAHNPQACALMRDWADSRLNGELHIVAGMLADKSLAATLDELAGVKAKWYLGNTSGPRGLSGSTLMSHLQPHQRVHANAFDSVTAAYKAAREAASENDRILVFGSFLTVADVLTFHKDSSIQ